MGMGMGWNGEMTTCRERNECEETYLLSNFNHIYIKRTKKNASMFDRYNNKDNGDGDGEG